MFNKPLLLLYFICAAPFAAECEPQLTRRSGSSVEVILEETAVNSFTPRAVRFTPLTPVPENLTNLMIVPAQSNTSCGPQCNPSVQYDIVYFTGDTDAYEVLHSFLANPGDWRLDNEIHVLTCEDLESCPSQRLPDPVDVATSSSAKHAKIDDDDLSSVALIPTLRPSNGPSINPSSHPSDQPSARPSVEPSWSPTIAPSLSPTTAIPSSHPTAHSVVKMHLRLDEEILWQSRNVHLLKSLVSSMYHIPLDVVQLRDVKKRDGGVDVEVELLEPTSSDIEVNFEDQVYITERLKDSSETAVTNTIDGTSVVSLDVLRRSTEFAGLADVICSSITENLRIVDVREVGNKLQLVVEANLKRNALQIELDSLHQLNTYSIQLDLPVQKNALYTVEKLGRLKKALSRRIAGVEQDDIKVLSLLPSEAGDSTAVDVEINSPYLENVSLTEEDKIFIVDSILGSTTGTTGGGAMAQQALPVALSALFLGLTLAGLLVLRKRHRYEAVEHHHLGDNLAQEDEPGAALGEPGDLLLLDDRYFVYIDPPPVAPRAANRYGEASDESSGEQESEGPGQEGRTRDALLAVNDILPDQLTDDEAEIVTVIGP